MSANAVHNALAIPTLRKKAHGQLSPAQQTARKQLGQMQPAHLFVCHLKPSHAHVVIGAPWKIAGIAPPFVVHLGCIGAALLVGSKGLLVIKGQGRPLSHSTTAQRTAQTQTKQQTTIKNA